MIDGLDGERYDIEEVATPHLEEIRRDYQQLITRGFAHSRAHYEGVLKEIHDELAAREKRLRMLRRRVRLTMLQFAVEIHEHRGERYVPEVKEAVGDLLTELDEQYPFDDSELGGLYGQTPEQQAAIAKFVETGE